MAWRYREALKAETAISDGNAGELSDRLVDDYLEKLIQIPYRIPRLSPAEIETYLTLLFCRRNLSAAICEEVVQFARKRHEEDRYRAFGLTDVVEALKGKTLPSELAAALRIGASIAGQITDVLLGNPRQLKRFLNTFLLRRKLAQVARLAEVSDDILVKLMLLEYAAPVLFEKTLSSIDGQTGLATILTELEQNAEPVTGSQEPRKALPAEWAGDRLRRWLRMEPHLATVDLRDYVWVTRDRLGSTLSSLTLVPAKVRTVLKEVLGGEFVAKAGYQHIREMAPPERLILAQQLSLKAMQNPGELPAFKAIIEIALIESSVANDFKTLIAQIPTKELSPALAVEVTLLAKKADPLGAVCKEIVSLYRTTDTRFGKALKQSNP